MKVDSSKLADLVTHELDKWGEETASKIKAWGSNIANEGRRRLKQVDMPVGSGGTAIPSINRRDWKHYSGNWKVKNRSGENFSHYTIHNGSKNDPTYRLTHLLEFGHATRNGKRTSTFPHIKDVEEWCVKTYLEGVERILKGNDRN